MSDDKADEYPKTIGWEKCPECDAQARRQINAADDDYVDVVCTANKDHNYQESRPPE